MNNKEFQKKQTEDYISQKEEILDKILRITLSWKDRNITSETAMEIIFNIFKTDC